MKRTVTIVGGGACALMLGAELDESKFDVGIYEKNAALGRKFLVAGDGGLNLTHSEPADRFLKQYSPFSFLEKPFRHFNNLHLVEWLQRAGVPTFTGSSGRIFPQKGVKPVQVLNVFLQILRRRRVSIHYKHEWKGFSDHGHLVFGHSGDFVKIKSDLVIFCLGGASWPVTGSAGEWKDLFQERNIRVNEFEASNCSFLVHWDEDILPSIEGKALKNIRISCGKRSVSGEVVITRAGIEGSGIYPLSPEIRAQLHRSNQAKIFIDLKPGLSKNEIVLRLKEINKGSLSQALKTSLNLSPVHLAVLKSATSKEEFSNTTLLAEKIGNLALIVNGTGPIEDAISSAGGIALPEITGDFELNKLPGHFAIGEMLDYDAPTGGYLLQSCFTMASYLASHLNRS